MTKTSAKISVLAILLAVLTALLLAVSQTTMAAPTADCDTSGSGGPAPLSSVTISFTCAADATVYFGVCDNGNVPDDDLFNIVFNGGVVSSNSYSSGFETVSIGEAAVAAGTHDAILNSLNIGFAEATYAYVISSDKTTVSSGLSSVCGTDFGGVPTLSGCIKNVPVFTVDTAPTDGVLRFDALFGTQNREEGITTKTWTLSEGQRINNDTAPVPAPNWARLWWQPDGEDTWYLLPSQYWMNDGTSKSEYGVSCNSVTPPSYHTAFENMIPASEVPTFNP